MSSDIPSKTAGAAGAGTSAEAAAVSRVPRSKIDPRVKTEVRGARRPRDWPMRARQQLRGAALPPPLRRRLA